MAPYALPRFLLVSFAEYAAHGWQLCAIDKGHKGPTYAGWNTKPIPADALAGIDGAGLLHALSGTCALDLDSIDSARPWLAERGVDVDALLADPRAVRIESGRRGRSKLLYRLTTPMRTLKPEGSGLELRCATADGKSVQDVLPPTVHPLTKKPYIWTYSDPLVGNWRALPPIPASLLALWRQLTAEAPPVEPPARSAKTSELEALIAQRDPDAPYDDWLKVGMILHHETSGSATGFALWDQWSAKGKKYKGSSDLKMHWLTFNSKAKRVVTAASLRQETAATADEFPDESASAPATIIQKAPRGARQASALGLAMKSSGIPHSNLLNASKLTANLLGGRLWFDEFQGKMIIQWESERPRPVVDVDIDTLQRMLQASKLDCVSASTVEGAMRLVSGADKRNCITDWLSSLTWDETPRLAQLMPRGFGTPDEEYYRVSGANWLIAMCARAFRPGCQVDEVLVLEGPQGSRKSSALRVLGGEWFKELTAIPDHKDFEQQLRGVWLGEFPELHSLQRGQIERIKQFITNREDHYRPSYGKLEVDLPRRCVMIGTTNRNDWNRDETGARRFIPIECGTIDLGWLETYRAQLFAEAKRAFEDGATWHEWPLEIAREKQRERMAEDSWEEVVANHVRSFKLTRVTVGMLLEQAIRVEVARQGAAEYNRMGRLLRSLGFRKQARARRKGERVIIWHTPDYLLETTDPLLA